MLKILPSIDSESYKCLHSKCLELKSFFDHNARLVDRLNALRDTFLILIVHHEFRSPWAINRPIKDVLIEKIFARHFPDHDKIVENRDPVLHNFVQDVLQKREELLLHFASDERVASKRATVEMHSCKISLDNFIATFVVPPFFGHFLGLGSVNAFIESLGIVFDAYSHDLQPFLASFDNSFLCSTLRQFFFSPLVRPYVGEQFTVFFDFFSSNKKAADGQQYTRIQRFFSWFLKEFATPIKVSPGSLRKLFIRITEKYAYEDKTKIIMTVVVYCIVVNLVTYPTAYNVFPVTSSVNGETPESIQIMKFYCASVCGLPIPHSLAKMPQVQEVEFVDYSLIKNLVDSLLFPYTDEEITPEMPNVAIPLGALRYLAKFEENSEVYNTIKAKTNVTTESIMKFRFDNDRYSQKKKNTENKNPEPKINSNVENSENSNKEEILDENKEKEDEKQAKSSNFRHNKEFDLAIELFASRNPNGFSNLSPKMRAIQLDLANKKIDFEEISSYIDLLANEEKEKLFALQVKIEILNHSIDLTKQANIASEAIFANNIVNGMMTDMNIYNELEKKKTLLMNDSTAFANFIISHLETFQSKNQWAVPMMRMIARRFHAQVMKSFPISLFASTKNQLTLTDQKFLIQKFKFLESLEENGIDESVEKIVSCKDILAAAQTAVLRACVFENPLESAKQIVLGLFVVEDLFTFEFGAPPEANQLMPLLANLFILSPIPNPFSFGEWLAHFLQKLMELKPEWFSDDSMRSMEHYFQFNLWMKDMLLSFDKS